MSAPESRPLTTTTAAALRIRALTFATTNVDVDGMLREVEAEAIATERRRIFHELGRLGEWNPERVLAIVNGEAS